MIEKFDFYCTPYGEDRTIHVYLPNDYYQSGERYPVVYMFDGQNLFYDSDATYGTCWGIREFLDTWWKKVIVVGMECSHHGNDRLSEYSPYPINSRTFGKIPGTGEQTMQWLINELKPHVDNRYRTWSHREATAIAGSSMGGMMALYAVLRHNNVFSKAAPISPAYFYKIKEFTAEIHDNDINPDTRVFIAWGSREDSRGYMRRYSTALASELDALGCMTYLYRQTSGRHCEADWRKQVPMWFDYLWGEPEVRG